MSGILTDSASCWNVILRSNLLDYYLQASFKAYSNITSIIASL